MKKSDKKTGKLNSKPKSKPVQEEEELTAEEQEALDAIAAENEEANKKVSFKKMEKAVTLLEGMFNLKEQGYSVMSFTDKGNSVKVSMTNGAFDVSVTINDAEAYGLMAE